MQVLDARAFDLKPPTIQDPFSAHVCIVSKTKDGESVATVHPFQPYFYMRDSIPLETLWRHKERPVFLIHYGKGWINGGMDDCAYGDRAKLQTCPLQEDLLRSEVCQLRDTQDGFTGLNPLKHAFRKLYWRSLAGFKRARNVLIQKGFDVYCADIPPELMFLNDAKIVPHSWVEVPKGTDSAAQYTRRCSRALYLKEPLTPIPSKLTGSWPNAPLVFASYDLETMCTKNGQFSDPEQPECEILCAGVTIACGKETRRRVFTLKTSEESREIVLCKDEEDLLFKFCEYIKANDTDVLMSYNGFQFDDKYLAIRAAFLGCFDETIGALSRFSTYARVKPPHVPEEKNDKLKGKNEKKRARPQVFPLDIPGRWNVDVLQWLLKMHDRDLGEGQALKKVANKLLKMRLPKNPIKTTEGSRLVTLFMPKPLLPGATFTLDHVDTPDETDDGKHIHIRLGGVPWEVWHQTVFEVVGRGEDWIQFELPCAATKGTQGGGSGVFLAETKRSIEMHAMFKAFREGNLDVCFETALYCLQDTKLPYDIWDKKDALGTLFAIGGVRRSFASMQLNSGSQRPIYIQVALQAHDRGLVFPLHKVDPDAVSSGYQGAFVPDPFKGILENLAGVDFASLYPSIIMLFNLCVSTLVKDTKYDNLPGVDYVTINGSRFAHVKALLPDIVGYLIHTRNAVKKAMRDATSQVERSNLNARQLALKICANAMYGVLGMEILGKLQAYPIAAAITAFGRESLINSIKFIEDPESYKELIRYSDTFPKEWPLYVRTPNSKKTAYNDLPEEGIRWKRGWVPFAKQDLDPNGSFTLPKYFISTINKVPEGAEVFGTREYSAFTITPKGDLFHLELDKGEPINFQDLTERVLHPKPYGKYQFPHEVPKELRTAELFNAFLDCVPAGVGYGKPPLYVPFNITNLAQATPIRVISRPSSGTQGSSKRSPWACSGQCSDPSLRGACSSPLRIF